MQQQNQANRIPSTSSSFKGRSSSLDKASIIATALTFCTASPSMARLTVFISTPAFLERAATDKCASRRRSSKVAIQNFTSLCYLDREHYTIIWLDEAMISRLFQGSRA